MSSAIEVYEVCPPCLRCGYVERIQTVDIGAITPEDRIELRADDVAYERHNRHEVRELLTSTPVKVLAKRVDLSPIRKQFGSWAVTAYGLECLVNYYPIHKARLSENWERHMSEKIWVLLDDFEAALRAARVRYRVMVSPGLRFTVFQRDGFRCRLCGHSADDGTTLEVDHIVPVARGGSSREKNLWTLCWECNRGKAAQLLENHHGATTHA